nr:hypothetical protein [Tanacetum cinerariifolium]
MTIDQQVAMDEALVPHAHRLRIERSNFRLLSDISSKESTLQLVYDVLRLTPFFKAFLVTADVLEIYMQEFWTTATVHHHSIRFKMDNKKHIVEHKDTKKSNEMYYPRFTKVIINHFMSKDPLIPRRNKVKWHYVREDRMFTMIKLVSRHQNTQQFGAMLPIELTNADIRNSVAYKEYYAVATGATPPKTKASVQKMKSSFDTTVTPPPTAAAGPRLATSAKGKQPATTSKAKSLSSLSEQTHISQASGSGVDEGTGTIPVVPDVPTDESEEEISWKSTNDEGDDNDDDDAGKDEEPFAGSDRGSKRRKEGKEPESTSAPKEKATKSDGKSTQRSIQLWISELAKQSDSRSSFNELMDTPVDFSAFLINRLKVDTLTSKLLDGPTYELMKGSCKSLVELEFFLEEVYKAMTDQLDWVNPKGASSRKYTTSVTKIKAVDYGHIKWIEDLVPRTMWIQEPVSYDKHALKGISHWGRKRQQFYGFAVNRESASDVYSKCRIIAVTELKIVEWHNYKHLDWITVCRDDDKLYKFKEGDFKRLRIQDI